MNSGTITLTGSTLAFRTTDDDANGSYSGISAVRLSAVPEPSTFALAAIGLAVGLFLYRRKHREVSSNLG